MFARIDKMKKWVRKQTESRKFQFLIGVEQGLGVGVTAYDTLGRLFTLTGVSGIAASILGYTNYAITGTSALVMTYATYTFVHVNVKNSNTYGKKVEELEQKSTKHEEELENIKGQLQVIGLRFYEEFESDIKLYKIMLQMPEVINNPPIFNMLTALLKSKLETYNAYNVKRIPSQEERHGYPGLSFQPIPIPGSEFKSDDNYHLLKETSSISLPPVSPSHVNSTVSHRSSDLPKNIASNANLFHSPSRRNSTPSFPNSRGLTIETEMTTVDIHPNSADGNINTYRPRSPSSM